MRRTTIIIGLLFLLLAGCTINTEVDNKADEIIADTSMQEIEQENQEFGPASNRLEFVSVPSDEIANALIEGKVDMQVSPIPPEQANILKNYSGIDLAYSPTELSHLAFNPAPSTEEILNPFSVKEIRFAINNLINREAIVEEVFEGYGSPRYTYITDASPDYKYIKDLVEEYDFSYDVQKAKKVITTEMTKLGAKMQDGIWYYNEEPVVLKHSIYNGTDYKNARLVSEQVATYLEEAGFTVEKLYYNRSTPKSEIPHYSNATELKWSIRTGAMVFYNMEKYDSSLIQNQAPYNEPLGYEDGFWNYENKELDRIAKALEFGDYETEEEWAELFEAGTKITIEEAYVVYTVTKNNIYAKRSDIENMVIDNFVAMKVLNNFRESYIPNKNTLVIGTADTFTEDAGINTFRFASNVNQIDMLLAYQDFFVWKEPNTYDVYGLRADFSFETNGPKETIEVPEDVFYWNVTENKWQSIPTDTKVKSKLILDLSKYLGTNWQDGSKITWADILYDLAQKTEKGYDKEWEDIAQSRTFDSTKGFRIDGNNLEIYLDFWHFDEGVAAYDAIFSLANPWQIFLASDLLVFNKEFMYSAFDANEYDVLALRLTDKSDSVTVLNKIRDIELEDVKNYFTVGDKVYISQEEIDVRKASSSSWLETNNNLMISAGPYIFESTDNGVVKFRANRDSTYPIKKGDLLVQ